MGWMAGSGRWPGRGVAIPRFVPSAAAAAVLLGAAGLAAATEPATNLSAVAARPAPEWLTRGVVYQVWLRSFTPEGTLKAATQRLPQVAELGATVVYLSPVCLQDDDMRPEFWSKRQKASGTNNPRNPYRIMDYNLIDPEYGTESDLREFIAAAHNLGLRVLMDMVYFHCGPASPLIDRPGFVKRTPDGKPFTGSWNFPVLDFGSAGLREHLWANMEHWVRDFDVDGFRCDVSDAVPLDFWVTARERLEKIRPDIGILAEGQRKEDQVRAFDVNYSYNGQEIGDTSPQSIYANWPVRRVAGRAEDRVRRVRVDDRAEVRL